jgi:hypothetical protein
MWLTLSVCNQQGLAALGFLLFPFTRVRGRRHSPKCVPQQQRRYASESSLFALSYIPGEQRRGVLTLVSRLEQTLNKPKVVLVVGVLAVALNVLLYFGLFLPRMTPLIAHINPIGTSLPEAISKSDLEANSNSHPEDSSKSDSEASSKSGPEGSLASETNSPPADSPPTNSPSGSPPVSSAPPTDSPSGSPPELPPLLSPPQVQYE